MTTFYWHDYETTGVSPARDRPSQFAGVRTDEAFNVIDEPLVIYCRPAIDILPAPEACLITGITPQLCREKGLVEAEFIARIHQQLATKDTCSVGYNSIRFDDEVTRYTLYRNFYDPYAREWQNGCSRWDIIDLVRMTYALRPEGINWPTNDLGKPSFRLEHLTAANGIKHEAAHDALSDVHATIAMAKLVRDNQPKLFQWLLDHRSKHRVTELIDIRGGKPLVHTTRMYPSESGCTSLVLPLGFESRNKSSLLVYDLRYAPEEFLSLTVPELKERLFVASSELPEGAARLPVKSLKINKCPAVAPLKTLGESAAERIQLDLDRCAKHREALMADTGFFNRVSEAFSGQTFPPADNVDAALYDGFFNDHDKSLIDRVRKESGAGLTGASFNFSDTRLEELLFRYRARNWPDSLEADELDQWRAHCMASYEDEERGLERFFEKLAELRESNSGDTASLRILDALEEWGDSLIQDG